ncbi:MAG: UPF0164 family protein [Treponema sp.]|nr:UPF0164 family protein [Treponema sp.]MCL2237881.1 UPF0164 family protein [Treponema sp.]
MSKKPTVFAAILVLSSLVSLWAAEGSEFFGNASDYLNNLYGIDDNAGLTVFPVLNIPMGGRSEGMAGAFSALADDISFLEFNPAGSSMLGKTELAFFHNNWIADTKIEGVAYATRFGDWGIAAGLKWLYLPFTEYNLYGERVSSGYYSEGVAILNTSYNFLQSYYFGGVSLGISIKGAFRMMPDYTDNFDNIIDGSGLSQSAAMIMADAGLLTRFDFLKGYSARERNTSAAILIRNLGPSSMGEPLPTVATAAISYKPIRPLTIAVDFNLPLNLTDISLSEMPYGSLGISANIASFLSMHAGFMLKPGSSRLTIGSEINLNAVSLNINYTLDFLTQMQPLNRISVGVSLDLGDRGRAEISARVDELYLLGLEAYSRGNLEDARLCWEEALRLNPRFDPARESMVMLEDREGLIQRVDDLYRLDF